MRWARNENEMDRMFLWALVFQWRGLVPIANQLRFVAAPSGAGMFRWFRRYEHFRVGKCEQLTTVTLLNYVVLSLFAGVNSILIDGSHANPSHAEQQRSPDVLSDELVGSSRKVTAA
jgi:hypothetical protein